MTDFGKQVDTEFKVRWALRGGHVHCALFSKPRSQVTWQKCGDFVLGVESWTDARGSFWEWEKEERE